MTKDEREKLVKVIRHKQGEERHMRICDICRGPTPDTWKPAVASVIVDRFEPVEDMKKYQSADVCLGCLGTRALKQLVPDREGGGGASGGVAG